MKISWRSAAWAVVGSLIVISGCKKSGTQGPSSVSTGGQATVMARINGEPVTTADVDEKIKRQLQDMRKQALEQTINQKLVLAEAKKKGVSEEELIKNEVEAKATPPSDAEIKDIFDNQVKPKQPEAKYEEYKGRIGQYLSNMKKQERAQAYFAELRKSNKVEIVEERIKVEPTGPSRGPENAPITIVEFSDFECPFCSRAYETVEQVMAAYPGKIRLVFRNFPLDFHEHAKKAAEAALCANEQGKFWEYYSTLFKNQKEIELDGLKKHASAVGLDNSKFEQCLTSGKHAETINKDMEAGKAAGVTGTPAFFINGIVLTGAQPLDKFKEVIDQELATN